MIERFQQLKIKFKERKISMCISDECKNGEITPEGIERRAFLTSATAAVVGIALASDIAGQQTIQPHISGNQCRHRFL